MSQITRVHLIVSGHVQGVGYRMFIHRVASGLNLSGWVRNLPDGTVEIDAQGSDRNIQELVERARKGTSRSQVTRIRKEEKTPDETMKGFFVSA
ncbi:MAG: acylphosphatase [Chlorobium sp.]|nr:MAG: acylphosphatase [Chlorobium sp.]